MHDVVKGHPCVSMADRMSRFSSAHHLVLTSVMLQAEFSILDFKATEEPTKVQLPLYIELKGKRMDTGCGTLTVCCHALLQARLHDHTLWKHIMSSANACALHLRVCMGGHMRTCAGVRLWQCMQEQNIFSAPRHLLHAQAMACWMQRFVLS